MLLTIAKPFNLGLIVASARIRIPVSAWRMWIRIQEVKEPDLKPVPVPEVKDVFEVFKQILFIFDHMHLDLDRA